LPVFSFKTASGTLIFHIMGALAQFERALIAERKAIKRFKGS
jgi:DNA invertase Pin-like site-specific DNA recombinase